MGLKQEWTDLVLKGTADGSLSKMEAPIPGGTGTYPLLGVEDRSSSFVTSPNTWSLRLVVRENFSEEQLSALCEFTDSFARFEEKTGSESIDSFLEVERVNTECYLKVDLNLLRNISEIKRLQGLHPEIETWVLKCCGQENDDPEELVGETIRQLTGVLANCQIIEIEQGLGEGFHSLWARLNVARIMALESDLQALSNPCQGAGLFSELQNRL